MNGITPAAVEQYMHQLLPPRLDVVEEMENLAERDRIPIIGPLVGRLLFQLAGLVGARRVFEMGSAIGYSTIWLAQAVGTEGRVYYTDGSAENAAKADAYLRRAGVRDRVEILQGNALELIDQVPGDFDIVFNDVDKHYYPEVYKKATGRVRAGGLFIADNVLWYGRVADTAVTDENTEGIRTFNRRMFSDTRFHTTIVPLRDGVMIASRLP